jgi:hypothetical protein
MVASYRAGNGSGINNLIAGLNATGHVTHTQHRKDKVTIHHNGGRLSHIGVLNVWKTRPASAHFDVDAAGNVAQYVEMNEYAWACGNTEGNQRSISIEMCNLATSSDWPVSETTWREAARLAGWIHAKVFGFRPTADSIVPHHHWKSTTCAGPYMDAHFGALIQVAQQAYDFFRSGGASNPVTPPPSGGKSIAQIADEVIAGKWGNGDFRVTRLRNAGYDPAAIQAEVNRKLGGGDRPPSPPPSRRVSGATVTTGSDGSVKPATTTTPSSASSTSVRVAEHRPPIDRRSPRSPGRSSPATTATCRSGSDCSRVRAGTTPRSRRRSTDCSASSVKMVALKGGDQC